MVSFNTILTLGALVVGFVVLIGTGGPSGLGQKIGAGIGSGFQQFSASLAGAFTGGLFGGNPNPDTQAKDLDTGTIGPAPRTGTEAFDPLGNLEGNLKGLQNLLDSLNNAVSGLFGGGQSTTRRLGADDVILPTGVQDLTGLSSGQAASLAFSQFTSTGPFFVQPLQGNSVQRTGERFISRLGGRTRVFGSKDSFSSFEERFNR